MPQQFTGTVEVLNSDSNLPTIILEGGDDERGGTCWLGGNGQDGDLVLRDGGGRQRIFLGASSSFARFEDGQGGITISLDGPRGTITAGARNASGELVVRDGDSRTVFQFSADNAQLVLGASGNPGDLLVRDQNGRTVFEFSAANSRLIIGGQNSAGNVFVRDRNNVNRIQLDGAQGDIKLFGGDCAEEFALAETVTPGTVLVIEDGLLAPAIAPYDSRVAGVASGANDLRPGIILGHDRAQGTTTPVALAGRVYCNIDASFGAIRPGDLLTTSSTRGHAMRASDRERAFGAVVGKALGKLSSGRALVPVLVGLN